MEENKEIKSDSMKRSWKNKIIQIWIYYERRYLKNTSWI